MATKTKAKLNNSITPAAHARPPVIVVVGHVDHGKTTLLDFIRKANVAGREAGGITQAVGAYEIVHTPAGGSEPRKMTFIDTPGHEAFSAMRARGAQIADLAILVVAADEAIRPQTKEAIKTLEDAKTPFIVAINKIDKMSGGNIEKIKNDLMTAGLMLEGYGGQISYHGISAKTGEGVNDLLDLVLLTADVENFTYDPSAPGSGFVLEASRDPQRGIEVSVIIKNGTLKRGDVISTPTASGKVKILENFLEKTVNELEPSAPAIVIGFESLPKVGEAFMVGELDADMAMAKRAQAASARQVSGSTPKNAHTLNLILKASDAGSLEALSVVLRGIEKGEGHKGGGKEIHIVDESVGDITDGDVRHALATNATIIGFKNKVEKGARNLGSAQTATIITSNIVYDLATAVEEFLTGARGPAIAGELGVLAVFNQERLDKQLVGGAVLNGIFRPKMTADILRNMGAGGNPSQLVGTAKILELREKKSEITQAEKSKEIGVLLGSTVQIQIGDKLVIRK
jgi:translation initiation factor IF-2